MVREAQVSILGGVTLNTCRVQIFLPAVDTVLVTDNEKDLNITALKEAMRDHKMRIYWERQT